LLKFYRALCNIRNAESALRGGTRKTIFADGNVLAYRRVDNEGSLLCVMNITDKTSELELDITESKPLLATSSDCRIEADGRMKRIFLPPFSGMLLK
jgi:glycosidase